jgi:hypothetical protein
MAEATEDLMNLAIGLARELPYLRPSQQRKISALLETPEQVWIFCKAVELALQNISAAESDEVLERVYLLGLEVRQIFDARRAVNLGFNGHWENISAEVIQAFVGGFKRISFDRTLETIHSLHSHDAGSSEPAVHRAYAIDEAGIVTVLEPEEEARPIVY